MASSCSSAEAQNVSNYLHKLCGVLNGPQTLVKLTGLFFLFSFSGLSALTPSGTLCLADIDGPPRNKRTRKRNPDRAQTRTQSFRHPRWRQRRRKHRLRQGEPANRHQRLEAQGCTAGARSWPQAVRAGRHRFHSRPRRLRRNLRPAKGRQGSHCTAPDCRD